MTVHYASIMALAAAALLLSGCLQRNEPIAVGPFSSPEETVVFEDAADRTVIDQTDVEAVMRSGAPDAVAVLGTALRSNSIAPFARAGSFNDDFSPDVTIVESGYLSEAANKDWAVTSGAFAYKQDGIGKTVQGSLPATDRWFRLYRRSNPSDTDRGAHPQNIFRFVLLKQFQNFDQSVFFRIKKDNLSASQYRNESNGLLLFNRYQSAQTLYYTGFRVDGQVVIKKKYDGTYYTLGLKKIMPGKYDRKKAPNLLPKDAWIGVRSVVQTLPDNTVSIKVYTDIGRTGNWTLGVEGIDNGQKYGAITIAEPGLSGIRTDFMDVEFDDYAIDEL